MSERTEEPKQRVILLAGAGASNHLGLPDLNSLLQRAGLGDDEVGDLIRDTRNSIESEPSRYKKAVFEELIVKIRNYLHTAFSLRSDHTLRKILPGLPSSVDSGSAERILKQALTRCYRVLLDQYGPNRIDPHSEEFKATLSLFSELARLNNGELHVFTTNYDCSYQVLASARSNLRFLSHIDNGNGRFSERWFFSQPDLENASGDLIYVHRLHGCVGWFNTCIDPDVMDMGMNCGSIREIWGSGSKLDIGDDDYLHNMCIKLLAAQLVGSNPVFSSAFEEFTHHLRKTAKLLVWGYSFRDLEVMRHIDHAMAMRSKPFQLLYLDPYLTEAKAKFYITKTLDEVPTSMAAQLDPVRLEWRPLDGLKELVRSVVERLQQEE